MGGKRRTQVDAFTATRRHLEWQAMLAKLDAASEALTGQSYGNSAKPAQPTNRAERRADTRARRRQRRARKG